MKKPLLFVAATILLAVFAGYYYLSSDYYEYAANSAQDCLPGELYDDEYKVCYFDYYCETDEECAEVDARYGQVLDSLADEYIESDTEHRDFGDLSEKSLVEESITLESDVLSIEEFVKRLLPEEQRSLIAEIIKDSDGPDGDLAYVEPLNDSGSEWRLAYDPADTYTTSGKYLQLKEVLTTIVHEIGHVIMLNDQQVKHVPEGDITCEEDQIILDEGCAFTNAYITAFVNKFWADEDRQKVYEASLRGEELSAEFFEANPRYYVTEYAATNAIEDMAESFALFILKDAPEEASIADEKVVFFYNYAELVELRKYMRGGVASILSSTSH